MKKLKLFWNKWKKIAYNIGLFNSKIILTVVYYIFLFLFVLIFKLKQIFVKKNTKNTNWKKIVSYTKTIEDARLQ